MRNWVGGLARVLLLFLSILSARGEILLDGEWAPLYHEDQPERLPGPDLVDYLGLPVNDAARLRAESWDASRLTLPEEQCRVHVSPYIYRGPLDFRIWQEKDPETQQVIAIKNYISTWSQFRTIWMDGRAHPPDWAPHTWMGFSTGKWEGDVLTVDTTTSGSVAAYISKLSPDAASTYYAATIGGGGTSDATTLDIDSAGDVYIAGTTTGNDFPVGPGAARSTGATAFAAKLDAQGNIAYREV